MQRYGGVTHHLNGVASHLHDVAHHLHGVENKTIFVERFPQLADPFATEWAAATTTARSIAPDYASLASQTSETDALKALVSSGANLYQTLILYVRLAFPGDATILRLFGQQHYEAARNSQLKLPVLLRMAFDEASKPENKTALIAKGMKETEIASLETLASEIVDQNGIQEIAMKKRSKDLDERIKAMNLVWEKMSLVCQCAKLVFQNDATRYNLFLLSDGDSQSQKTEEAPSQMENA
jgi:hypothetical protein